MSREEIIDLLMVANFLPRIISFMQMSLVFMLILSARKTKRYTILMKIERKQK